MKKLVKAIRAGDVDGVRAALSRSPDLTSRHDSNAFGATALIHAVQHDSRDMVDALLDAGADIDQRSDWWAGSFGVLDHASDDMAEYLLSRGATLTPHAAARLGRVEALRAQVAADPTVVRQRGGDGQYPLHFARTAGIADIVLDAGADIDARDLDHESTAAQWLAMSRPEVAAHLVERGCEPDLFLAVATGSLEVLARLVAADPQGVDAVITRDRFSIRGKRAAEHIYFYTIGEGCSLLHAAAAADQARVIRWLCGEGANLGARGGYDASTPLHTAAWNDSPDAVHALIECGADKEAPSGAIHKNEPLGWAIVSGASEAFRALLDGGATVREAHRKDAERGAIGEFRQFNRARPLEEWVRIRDAIRLA